MQDYTSSNKIKENKYKILRMSLLLGSDENREETLNNFEDAACEIDAMNDETYIKDLEDKFYDTTNLEEEEKKLTILVDYIGGRVEQRISLLTDFANVTGYDLQDLPPIKYYDKLDDYKERLKYIREYLDNTNKLNTLNEEVTSADEKLEKAYKNKAISEEFNQRNEEILLNKFQHIIKSLDYFKDINEENIQGRLAEIISSVEESKKSLDIFTKSFTTLANSGISLEEEEEYHSYVVSAEEAYYTNKEKEYMLRLYQSLIHKETEYNAIILKRESINNLLYERLNIRKDLSINDTDILISLYDLLEKQYEDIKYQKENIEDIDNLNELIRVKKEEMNELELDNQKVEILALLREFCIIDTYSDVSSEDTETIEIPFKQEESSHKTSTTDDKTIEEPVKEQKEELPSEVELPEEPINDIFEASEKEVPKEEEKNDDGYTANNQVVKVENATNIDLDLVHSKANKVMKRVGEMLGIKQKEEQIISVTNEIEEQLQEENNSKEEEKIFVPSENPLFNNDNNSDKKENETITEPSSDDENNFWFPSDTPDALNELPDLEIPNNVDNSNNFFANNNMPDLNFPDLKIDFGNTNTEAGE